MREKMLIICIIILAGTTLMFAGLNFSMQDKISPQETSIKLLPVGIKLLTKETIVQAWFSSEDEYHKWAIKPEIKSSWAIIDDSSVRASGTSVEKHLVFGEVDFKAFTTSKGLYTELPKELNYVGRTFYEHNFDGEQFKIVRAWIWTGKQWTKQDNNGG